MVYYKYYPSKTVYGVSRKYAIDLWNDTPEYKALKGHPYIPFMVSSTLLTDFNKTTAREANSSLVTRGITTVQNPTEFNFYLFCNDVSLWGAYNSVWNVAASEDLYPETNKDVPCIVPIMATASSGGYINVAGGPTYSGGYNARWAVPPTGRPKRIIDLFRPILYVGHIVDGKYIPLQRYDLPTDYRAETVISSWEGDTYRRDVHRVAEGFRGFGDWGCECYWTFVLRYTFSPVSWDFRNLEGGLQSNPILRVAMPWMRSYPDYVPWDEEYTY